MSTPSGGGGHGEGSGGGGGGGGGSSGKGRGGGKKKKHNKSTGGGEVREEKKAPMASDCSPQGCVHRSASVDATMLRCTPVVRFSSQTGIKARNKANHT